jgi:hypothetical protein
MATMSERSLRLSSHGSSCTQCHHPVAVVVFTTDGLKGPVAAAAAARAPYSSIHAWLLLLAAAAGSSDRKWGQIKAFVSCVCPTGWLDTGYQRVCPKNVTNSCEKCKNVVSQRPLIAIISARSLPAVHPDRGGGTFPFSSHLPSETASYTIKSIECSP